jgi:hypothetical protein
LDQDPLQVVGSNPLGVVGFVSNPLCGWWVIVKPPALGADLGYVIVDLAPDGLVVDAPERINVTGIS